MHACIEEFFSPAIFNSGPIGVHYSEPLRARLLTCPLVHGVWQQGEGAGTTAVRVPWQAYSRHFAYTKIPKNVTTDATNISNLMSC